MRKVRNWKDDAILDDTIRYDARRSDEDPFSCTDAKAKQFVPEMLDLIYSTRNDKNIDESSTVRVQCAVKYVLYCKFAKFNELYMRADDTEAGVDALCCVPVIE